mmetsp:Transcript_34727/g.53313  ORF Transcript_34727/g.53313 Transcript_34727/m.53313 type:complete len:85 (+) Transcript_34727:509-763(+)
MISRRLETQRNLSLAQEFSLIKNTAGLLGGLIPYTMVYFYQSLNCTIMKKEDEDGAYKPLKRRPLLKRLFEKVTDKPVTEVFTR